MRNRAYLIIFFTILFFSLINADPITGGASQQPTNVSIFVLPGAPIIYIYSPQNITYYETSIFLNYSIRNPFDNAWYNLDLSDNISLGNLADNSLTFTTTFGYHILYLFANSSYGTRMENVLFTVSSQEPPPSSSSGSGGGSGGGIITTSFEINKNLIEVSIFKGETKTETLEITNTGTTNLKIDLSTNINLAKIQDSLTLAPKETKKTDIQFSSDIKPGIYPGKIYLTAGAISKSIDFVLEIKEPESIFDISLKIPEKYKETNPGKKVSFSIDITKIGAEGTTNADLSLYLTDFQRNLISEKTTEPILIDKNLLITRELKIPSNIKEGTYLVITELSYNSLTASSYDTFDVVKKQGLPFSWWLLIILAIVIALIIILTLNLLAFKKQYEEKEVEKINGG